MTSNWPLLKPQHFVQAQCFSGSLQSLIRLRILPLSLIFAMATFSYLNFHSQTNNYYHAKWKMTGSNRAEKVCCPRDLLGLSSAQRWE